MSHPSEHFIIAALPILAYVLVRDRRLPTARLGWVVFVGSQFPDLVDKPLAHQVGLLPSGRVFMHSLPFALPITAAVCWYGWRTDRPRLGGAFAIAYLSHLLADNYKRLLRTGEVPSDLLWPFVAPLPRPAVPHWAGPNSINVTLWTVFSVVVLGICVYRGAVDIRAHRNRLW